MIVTRAAIDLGDTIKQKISLFGSLPVENIIEAKDVAQGLYEQKRYYFLSVHF